eukprot:m.32307 g.32307  ORF g.32307 m.32307 type:complete len:72 (-) comp16623_c2_seq1:242-457(-)
MTLSSITSNSHLTLEGTLTAMASGAMLAFGWSLLQNETDIKSVSRMTTGGAIFTAGLYLWAPATVRRAWLN